MVNTDEFKFKRTFAFFTADLGLGSEAFTKLSDYFVIEVLVAVKLRVIEASLLDCDFFVLTVYIFVFLAVFGLWFEFSISKPNFDIFTKFDAENSASWTIWIGDSVVAEGDYLKML